MGKARFPMKIQSGCRCGRLLPGAFVASFIRLTTYLDAAWHAIIRIANAIRKGVYMEAIAEHKLPVAMRLPRHEVEVVSEYARKNGLTKTDAFLYFLRQGMANERSEAYEKRFDEMERLLGEILHKVDASHSTDVDSIAHTVSLEARKFPAIQKIILFGSFARGEAGSESDIDLRLILDRSHPFSLYDLVRFQKAVGQATGREVDAITADDIKNENLACAIDMEGVTIYER